MQARWNLLDAPSDVVKALSREAEISELVARLLVQRGLQDPVAAEAFLNPRLDDLHDPYLMKDMACVVARVVKAVKEQEPLLIYGDYDVDGITAIVVLRRALEMLGGRADFYLPNRLEEGYGLKAGPIKRAAQQGYRLIVSVDSGIRAFEACEAAREAAVDLIVTDHHLPDSTLPPAYAILNPRRPDCFYPEKNLAAVGVVFKLVQALFQRLGKGRVLEHFLKLVAIGTIADMVPLTGENRIMVKHGLERLADPRNIGLKALLEGAGVGRDVSFADVGFRLAPRMNAVTRMGGGQEVVNLFSVKDAGEAEAIVQTMNQMNASRQREETAVLEEIEERLQAGPGPGRRNFLVFCGEGWHRGVIGIVASRLVERYHRPVLILSSDGQNCQGSGRSIPDFHLLKALDSCRDLLSQHGGHAQAGGCTLPVDNLGPLEARLEEYAADLLGPDQLCPSLRIDATVRIESMSVSLVRELERLAPFGIGNPVPVFVSEQVRIAGGPWVLKERHLKLRLGNNGSRLDAIWWKNGDISKVLNPGQSVNVAYTPNREVYQGRETLLLNIRDLRST